MIQITDITGCCAVQEIYSLQFQESPEKTLEEFCTKLWPARTSRWDSRAAQMTHMRKASAFYIFTSVEDCKEWTKDLQYMKYGSILRDYILKNKLGPCTKTPARWNRVNHPDHKVVVFVWAPNQKNLEAWWAARKEEKKNATKSV